MRLTDALSGALLVLLGLFTLRQAAQFPSFGGQPYGAALLPSILAWGLIAGGALLVLRDVMARRQAAGGAWLEPVPELRRGGLPALLAVLGNVVAQIWLTPRMGFVPVSVIGLLVLFLVLRLRPLVAAVLAVGTSLACWWIFALLLRVPLPRGLLDGVL